MASHRSFPQKTAHRADRAYRTEPEYLKLPAGDQAFEREFASGDKVLHLNGSLRFGFENFWIRANASRIQRRYWRGSRRGSRRATAASAHKDSGFQAILCRDRHREEAVGMRRQQTGRAESFTREKFIVRGDDGFGRAERIPSALQPLPRRRARAVANRDDSIERSTCGEVGDGDFSGSSNRTGNGIIAPWVFERVTTVGREHQVDIQAPARLRRKRAPDSPWWRRREEPASSYVSPTGHFLYKRHLRLIRLRSTVPGLVEIGDRGARHEIEIL